MAGVGPPLLLAHQSPRSSAEYESLMERWSAHFTCIAPDTPGYGQSSALPGEPELADFAEALIGFMDAVGLGRTGAYGFHSGGIILVAAASRHPERFTAVAVGGYAVWTEEERRVFGAGYLPPFKPLFYGEHLTWVWNRILEQSWFFPWFDARPETRLPRAHAEPDRVDAIVREMLDSGDAYRMGYGAVLRAPRGIPGPEARTPPVLITAYDGDPLQAHLARLGKLPAAWSAQAVASPADHEQMSLSFLLERLAPQTHRPRQVADEGFLAVAADGFEGLIHWCGARDAGRVVLHPPGESVELLDPTGALLIDLPGHGLSDAFAGEADVCVWARVVASAVRSLSTVPAPIIVGRGISALLALAVSKELSAPVKGEEAHIPLEQASGEWLEELPGLTPDRFGSYLTEAWSVVRASRMFWPWFRADARHAIPFTVGELEPHHLALRHRALIRARSFRPLMRALLQADREALWARAPRVTAWHVADWARGHVEMWQPSLTAGERREN